MIDPIQIYLIPIRGFEASIYLLCYFLLVKKQKMKDTSDPGYLLNNVYMKVFLFWALYMVFDTISGVIVPLSLPDNMSDLVISGVKIEYFQVNYISWIIANILRDLQLIFSILHLKYTYTGSQIIKYGEEKGHKEAKKKYITGFYIFLAIGAMFFDGFVLEINENSKVFVSRAWDTMGPFGWIVFFLYLAAITYSLLIPFREFYKNRGTLAGTDRKKLLLFNIGFGLLLIGIYYWLISPFVEIFSGIPFMAEYPIIYEVIGHTIWTLAPIAFYNALRIENFNKK